MKTRFHIPKNIQSHLAYKGRNLRSLSGYDLTFVFENFSRLQRKGKPDVTVAIPAYNEEKTIHFILILFFFFISFKLLAFYSSFNLLTYIFKKK